MRLRTHSTIFSRAISSSCALAMSAALLSTVQAETLDNLMDSKAMQDFKVSKTVQGREKKAPAGSQWLRGIEPNTNFATIWDSSNSPQALLNWAGAKLPYFSYKRPRAARNNNFVTAEAELSNFDRVNCRLAIMIPHPSIAPLVESNILEEFRRLRPPMLEVVGEKQIPLTVGQGTLYEHKDGGASLLIPVSQHGVVRITTLAYKDSSVLIEIAKGLDIDRLNRKLDS